MEVDTLMLAENEFVGRIHSNRPSGKLHRGHNITAATASIPSKYQTIVIDNADKKGFLARSRRFNHVAAVDTNPGPGSYVDLGTFVNSSTSLSKKGTGGFASKDRRISRHRSTCGPGSAAYSLSSVLVTRKDYNQAATTSMFHMPIAPNTKKWDPNPAPNKYQVANVKTGKANNVCADAAFKSKSKRDIMNLADARSKPAPWQYHINDELTKDSVKVPFSCFKSKTVREMRTDDGVPGPGSYKPNEPIEPVQKTVFPRKHYLCISAPAMPLPATPPAPGPGQYETSDYQGQPKHFMSGAVFVSTTGRWTGAIKDTDQPGPAHYRPSGPGKQSFIYNGVGRWI